MTYTELHTLGAGGMGVVYLAELGLIDEYEFVVHPKLVGQLDIGSGAVAIRYEPKR